MVEIQGAVTTSLSPVAGASFTCIVPNSGEFMVTPDVLSMMSPTPAGGPSVLLTLSTLTVGTFGQGTFSAPGLDNGIVSYNDGWVRQSELLPLQHTNQAETVFVFCCFPGSL